MHFELTDEQVLLRDSVRRYVDKDYRFEARVARVRGGQACDAGHWAAFANQGWLAAPLPEAAGGLGGDIADTLLIAAELGRGLVIEPFVANAVLAAQTLVATGRNDAIAGWGPRLADGSARLALACTEPGGKGWPRSTATTATRHGPGYRLQGRQVLVPGGADADAYLVPALIGGDGGAPPRLGLFLVDARQQGVSRQALPLHDGSWAADLSLDAVDLGAQDLLAEGTQAEAALRLGVAYGTAALCAQLVGAMEKAIELTAEYLKVRKQFGVAISSFQALQHRMSDMAAEMEVARSMLFVLAAAIANDDGPAMAVATSQAKAMVGRAARWVCGQAIQLHGGIGMTEEFAIGHYFKHAVVADFLLGNADAHDALNAARLQADAAATPEAA